MYPLDNRYWDPFGEPVYQSRNAQKSYGGGDEDARTRYLGFAEVLGQSYGCDRFHGLHGQGYAEGEARQNVGESAEDKRAGEGYGADLRQRDQDGEKSADVTERTGYLGEGLPVEGTYVVSLGLGEVRLCFPGGLFQGFQVAETP